ncbi:MAG: hypothetical protein IJN64_07105 [Lachnospiraceae bacterium]|nr:hypothetical protein [Lachnospiraceae bacterium]
MKVLKFYMNRGIPQTVTIEEILGYPYEEKNQPRIASISIRRMDKCDARDRDALWSFSKFLALKGKPADYWCNMNCYTNPYNLYWTEYVEYCEKNYVNVVDDLLEVMLDAHTFSESNFIKVIVNEANNGDYNVEDYAKLKKSNKNLDRFFDACI